MSKKVLVTLCAVVMMFTACSSGDKPTKSEEELNTGVELEVITTFAGNDGNSQNYRNYCREWVEQTGHTIIDKSSLSDETFKTRVINDFVTGSEPDVLFFFNGADANNFIEAGKVVSLDEIREVYPDFASNLNTEKIPTSLVDDKIYAIPVNGYWEAMFVNTAVLEAAGVNTPGEDYTWEQFLKDCDTIKRAGYIPIAASLGNIPHYWWEFSIFNHTGADNHMMIPGSVEDEGGQAWIAGLNDIKELYRNDYFPRETTTISDDVTFSMFMDGEAAFLIDGSWKVGSIVQNCQSNPEDPATLDVEKLEQFDVTFVPGTEARKATDIIGGMSMGYYITRDAWEDPATREAAVSFVSYMTSDEVIPDFAQHTSHIMLNPPETGDAGGQEYNSLQRKALDMLAESTSLTGAVQDIFQGDCRESTFDKMPEIVTGQIAVEDAVAQGLEIYYQQN